MKIFLYEHITATSDPRDPLYGEGAAMRDAMRADLNAIADVELLDGEFDRCAATAEWTILIAPETGGILEALAERVIQLGGCLLGPSPDAIRLASDKLALAERWQKAGVQTPATKTIGKSGQTDNDPPGLSRWDEGMTGSTGINPVDRDGDVEVHRQFPEALIVKPRDGAGSERMALIRNAQEFDAFLRQHPEGMIVQPFIPGTPASIAFLVGPNKIVPLQPTRQLLTHDFHYLGGELPLPTDLAQRAVQLGLAGLETAGPGWLGYIGIDMILGDAGDFAIEINPRLTTSYVGLRKATQSNLAEVMLRIAMGKPVPEIVWNTTTIRW